VTLVAPRALGVNRVAALPPMFWCHPRYLFAYDPLSEAQACTYPCSGHRLADRLPRHPLESLISPADAYDSG